MLQFWDVACVVIAFVSLSYILRARREQAVLAKQVDALNKDVQSLAAQVATLLNSFHEREENRQLDRVKHDLRSPLTSALGFCTLLKQTSDGFSPKQERLLHNINAAAQRMLEIVGVDDDSRA